MRLLVTGGAGFIGSNFIRHMLAAYPRHMPGPLQSIVCVDKLTYAGSRSNLKGLENDDRFEFVEADILDSLEMEAEMRRCDAVVHFAAETHVDKAILSWDDFFETNERGTVTLLKIATKLHLDGQKLRFVHISTDEVFGSLRPGEFTIESTARRVGNTYAASKAAAEHWVEAAHNTYGLDTIITRGANHYGPYQFTEKFIPVIIKSVLRGQKIPVYGTGQATRDWIYVEDACRALDLILHAGVSGASYGIGARNPIANIDLVKSVLGLMGASQSLISYVADRPGHDMRYATDPSALESLGFAPVETLQTGLAKTIEWYSTHQDWIAERDPDGAAFFSLNYEQRDRLLQNALK